MTEQARFDFILARDGREAALRFLRENVVKQYRRAVLGPTHGMYRRGLIESYVEAKRIIRREGA